MKVDFVNLSSLLCQTPFYTQIRAWEPCARIRPTQPSVSSSVLTRLFRDPFSALVWSSFCKMCAKHMLLQIRPGTAPLGKFSSN